MNNTIDEAYIQQQLDELRQRYVDSLSSRIQQALTDIASLSPDVSLQTELQEVFRQIHSLSGSAATFGFKRLSEHARQLELILKNFMDLGNVLDQKSIDYLHDEVTKLKHMVVRGAELDVAERYTQSPPPKTMAIRSEQRDVYILETVDLVGCALADHLNQQGYNTIHFTSLNEAISAIQRKTPDVLLVNTDYLPVVTEPEGGPSGTSSLFDGSVPCVFISSDSDWDYRLAAVRAGGKAYMTMPVDMNALTEHLDRLTRPGQSEPGRVLVVDDASELSQHYALVLRQAGMYAESVNDPSVLLEKIESFRPQLILLDYYFPGITGLEISRVLRQHPETADIPIVFLSTEKEQDVQLETLGSGDDFLEKPISDALLVHAVEARLERS